MEIINKMQCKYAYMALFNSATLAAIKRHSLNVKPTEACGILAGTLNPNVVSKVVACENVDSNPHAAYTIDPTELLNALTELDISPDTRHIGFYHSHPFSSAAPSNIDVARATWDSFLYAIYSVRDDRLKCYIWCEEENRFKAVKVIFE